MKKAAILLVMLVYLISAIGVTATSFYCCGVLRSVSYTIGDSINTKKIAGSPAENCCKTTKRTIKVKDNHVGSAAFFTFNNGPLIIAVVYTSYHICELPDTKSYRTFYTHWPPSRRNTPIYILNCNYRT